MAWYKNMTEKHKKDFKKVLGTSSIGVIMVLLVPVVFHLT